MLFVQDQYRYLVKDIVLQEHYVVEQFANQEYVIKSLPAVLNRKCLVIGSLTSSADQALSLLLLLYTLVQEGAEQVILYSPYLGYQRQDFQLIGQSEGLQWADRMLLAAGVDTIISIDPHCLDYLSQLQIPVMTQTTESIFDQEMAYFVSMGFTFIFPDQGAALRYHWIQETFPSVSQGWFLKKRSMYEVELQNFNGKLSNKVMICDDILDSGQTLIQTCIVLKQMGVQEIVIFVSHAFFHGTAWNDLWSLGVKVLYCTNSTFQSQQLCHPSVCVKSIMPLMQKYL